MESKRWAGSSVARWYPTDGNISPRIHGIKITTIVVENSIPNGVLFVVDIPKGQTAHQASDKKYYKRFNFISTAMDDSEIKDIINRQNRTTAYVRFRLKSGNFYTMDSLPQKKVSLEFDIIASNDGIKAISLLDCIIVATEPVAKQFLPQLGYNGRFYQAYYNNEEDHVAQLNGEEVVLDRRRMPILGHTYRPIGEIAIWSDFFLENLEIKLLISTDDNRLVEQLRGKEVIENRPGELRFGQ